MAEVVVIVTVPSRELYEQVSKHISEPPSGLIVHTATEVADGVRIIGVWESREAADAFDKNVISPIVERLMAEFPGEAPPEGPVPETLEPFAVMRG